MDKHTGKTSEELRAEYLKIRAQAEQDVADLNSGRVMAPFSSLRRMVRRKAAVLRCWVMGRHDARWSPDDADDYCRRCGKDLRHKAANSPNGGTEVRKAAHGNTIDQ